MGKVLIAVGGTGGHLFPAKQLSEMLEKDEVLFVGHKLSTTPFFDQHHPFIEIASGGGLKKIHLLLKGIIQSFRIILRFQPDVVVGFGSFHSFPVLIAAAILRKKIVLFEANCTLGKANRFLAPAANKIAFQFPVKHKKATYVPLLPWIEKKKTFKKYDKDPELFTLLVFGGSQGARFLNQTIPKVAKILTFPVQVIHLTGKDKSDVRYSVPSMIMEFESDMEAAYSIADLVICRSGASTVAELIRYQKPALIVPYPYAYDHQKKNGEFLGNGAKVVAQKEATPERLASEIEHLKRDLEKHRQALQTISFPKTVELTKIIHKLMEE